MTISHVSQRMLAMHQQFSSLNVSSLINIHDIFTLRLPHMFQFTRFLVVTEFLLVVVNSLCPCLSVCLSFVVRVLIHLHT